MAFINKCINSFIAVSTPTGLWEKIIMAFNTSIANYASAIIVLTLVIKLVLLPLDYLNRRVSRKQMAAQSALAPEMEKIKAKYGNDKNVLNQKTAELYKKNNVNMGGSCIIMLVNLVLTLVIFFTLFSGLNTMAAYKIQDQYQDLRNAYYGVESEDEITEDIIAAASADTENANKRVEEKYQQVQESWLWIKNVWIADSPLTSSIPDYSSYASTARFTGEEKADEAKKAEYEKIMNPLRETTNQTNGYFIIVIVVVLLSVAQQLIANKSFIKKPKDTPKQKQNWLMLVLLPLLMGYFALQYNAVFAIYIATSSLFAVITTPIINTILDATEKKRQKKTAQKNTVSYSRKVK